MQGCDASLECRVWTVTGREEPAAEKGDLCQRPGEEDAEVVARPFAQVELEKVALGRAGVFVGQDVLPVRPPESVQVFDEGERATDSSALALVAGMSRPSPQTPVVAYRCQYGFATGLNLTNQSTLVTPAPGLLFLGVRRPSRWTSDARTVTGGNEWPTNLTLCAFGQIVKGVDRVRVVVPRGTVR